MKNKNTKLRLKKKKVLGYIEKKKKKSPDGSKATFLKTQLQIWSIAAFSKRSYTSSDGAAFYTTP